MTNKILLITQWPEVKNGEYELIEKIKRTNYDITVVDRYGFTVGDELNSERVDDNEYLFAISFHFDTPRLLNVPTYYWVANPLAFMHLRHDYRDSIVPLIRANDGYLFNGSAPLKNHISRLATNSLADLEANLEFYPSVATQELVVVASQNNVNKDRLFYCGVNWERATDGTGRAQGLLAELNSRGIADFYGPRELEGKPVWEDFNSYLGEIPFDGTSSLSVMSQYGAVLAISSPAHLKSKTSSSRVFEGLSAGVPVISDRNPHVIELFGDAIFYFDGNNPCEQADSIQNLLQHIKNNEADVRDKVRRGQKLLSEKYNFEPCLDKLLSYCKQKYSDVEGVITVAFIRHTYSIGECLESEIVDLAQSINELLNKTSYKVNLIASSGDIEKIKELGVVNEFRVSFINHEADDCFNKIKLGELLNHLVKMSDSDVYVLFSNGDYPVRGALVNAARWFENKESPSILIGGHYSFDGSSPHSDTSTKPSIFNSEIGSVEWGQNSVVEFELGSMFFDRQSIGEILRDGTEELDVCFPLHVVLEAKKNGITIERYSQLFLRRSKSRFHCHYDSYTEAVSKGFWYQHYEMVTNFQHEFNALIDLHHGDPYAEDIISSVAGRKIDRSAVVADPAVYRVNKVIEKIRPLYRFYKKLRPSWL